MKTRIIALFLVALLATFAMAGYSSAAEDTYTIAFSTRTLTNAPLMTHMVDVMTEMLKPLGHELVVMTTDTPSNVGMQVNQLEDCINMGVDAIIMIPLDGTSSIETLKKAKAEGIPVIIVDGELAPGNEDLYVSMVATDNYNAGVLCGKHCAETVKEGKAVIVQASHGIVACDERARGFMDTLKAESNIEIALEQACGNSSEGALEATENMLTAVPDANVLFIVTDSWLSGVIEAVNGLDKRGDLAIYSVDGAKQGVDFVESGDIVGTAQQFAGVQAETAMNIALDILDGKTTADDYEKFIDSGALLITKENLEVGRENAL